MKKIRYLDMFAGVGGFRSGLTNAGDFFVPVGWCEIDPFAQRAYRALYETEGEYFCDDATRINPEELPEFDLLCAGFPCQPFSVSGRRLGFADTRGTLFHEIVRVAEARRPAYLLLENVPGLLNHEGGKTFGTIIAAIHELGYSLEWCVLNSTNFGVPQQRRRVYIVGYLDSRLSGKIFPLAQGYGTPLKQIIPGGQGQRVYSTEGASTCLTSQGGGWGAKTGLYFVDMNAEPKVTHEARCITARQDSGISNRKGEHSGVIITGARAVLTPERKTVRQQGRRMKEPDEPMFTLTAMDKHGVEYNGRVRRLMPKECFRLQGYTDAQFDKLVEIGIPEAQLYKMAGNSVTTNVVTAVGLKLKQEVQKLEWEDKKAKSIFHRIAEIAKRLISNFRKAKSATRKVFTKHSQNLKEKNERSNYMPNHVINRLEFYCSEERLKEILSAICYDDKSEVERTGIGTIDFNKITPMPQSLDIESGSSTDRGINLYLTSVNPSVRYYGKEKMDPAKFASLLERLNSSRFLLRHNAALTPEEIQNATLYHSEEEVLNLGKTAIDNLMQYGATTWYEWRTRGDTWNTKWNSYNAYNYDGGNEICFQTAWSAPHPIIEKLSAMYPEVTIKHRWANEDLWQGCGSKTYRGGEMIDYEDPCDDMNHLETAASIWGNSLEDYGLVENASRNSYVNIENETYELVSVCGQPGLFSNGKLTKDDIPRGLFVYHLRSGSDGEQFCAIENRVSVNHGGSIVTSEPLDLGKNGFLPFDDEHTLNFMGEDITFGQFMEGDFETKEAVDIEQN